MNDFNVTDDLKQSIVDDIRKKQHEISLPYHVMALNITGDLNVGMMMRSACIFGASSFRIFGRRVYDRRSTVGAQNYIPVDRVNGYDEETGYDTELFRHYMYGNNLTPIFVEQGGVELCAHNTKEFHRPCYIFGNESHGIPQNIIDTQENPVIVSVKQIGVLRSLNVSSTAAIVMHHVMNTHIYGFLE